jgi:RimJ/RimL family protein N-acetyltransferase
MNIIHYQYHVKGLHYRIRQARVEDAGQLPALRLKIDGETEYLDRERGEGFIDQDGFKKQILEDSEKPRNLFLVAEVSQKLVAFSRCEGSELRRMSHKVEFGVGVLKDFWGYGIGKNLLKASIDWAESEGVQKMSLSVLERNEKAIKLYEKLGFKREGLLQRDKVLSDGQFYNTVLMGRFKS